MQKNMTSMVIKIMVVMIIITLSSTGIFISSKLPSIKFPSPEEVIKKSGEIIKKAKDVVTEGVDKLFGKGPGKEIEEMTKQLQEKKRENIDIATKALKKLTDRVSRKKAPFNKTIYIPDHLRYNEVSWLATHNSTSIGVNLTDLQELLRKSWVALKKLDVLALISGFSELSQLGFNPTADQHYPLEQQFQDGIRAFKIPIHATELDPVPMVMHTQPFNERSAIDEFIDKYIKDKGEPALIKEKIKALVLKNVDQTPVSLEDFLKKIVSFLQKDPKSIISLFSDEHLPGRESAVWTLAKQNVINAFLKSGAYKYLHIQKNDEPWPTIQELRARDKRLVVFYDGGFSTELLVQYPWAHGLHYTDRFTSSTHWTHETLEEIMREDSQVSKIVYPADKDKIPATQIVYRMYYFITPRISDDLPGMSGSASLSQILHSPENLQRKIDHFKRNVGKKPTIIMVDFYDQGFDNLVDAVNKLNHVEEEQKK